MGLLSARNRLINPPRIAKTADGRWRCVAGARRLRALQQIVREDGEPERGMVLCTYYAPAAGGAESDVH